MFALLLLRCRDLGKRNLCCGDRGGKILFAVSQRDKVRFKLGGRKIDALFQHTVEINAERILITGGCILIIFYFLIRKEDREHGTQMMDADRDTGLLSSLF